MDIFGQVKSTVGNAAQDENVVGAVKDVVGGAAEKVSGNKVNKETVGGAIDQAAKFAGENFADKKTGKTE